MKIKFGFTDALSYFQDLMTDNKRHNVYLGDIHNMLDVVNKFSRQVKNYNIIQVGDFGFGFGNQKDRTFDFQRLETMTNALRLGNNHLYVIRGNHDNPNCWDGRYNNEFITLVPDFTIMELAGYTHLFIGGATSPNRLNLLENNNYWKDEILPLNTGTFHPQQQIDVVVTHTCPDFCFPLGLGKIVSDFEAMGDKTLRQECLNERRALTQLYSNMIDPPEYWFYGHFHNHCVFRHNDTEFRLLNVNEFFEIGDITLTQEGWS